MKKFIVIFFNFLLLVVCANSHATSAEVKRFVESTSTQVIKIVESSSGDTQKFNSLSKIFIEVMDIDWIAKFVLGQQWNSLSQDQKVRYMQAYRKFLLAKYVNLFRDYNGQTMRIEDVKEIGNNTFMATTFITNQNNKGSEYKVQYRIKEDGSNFRIRDIVAESISMISTQRSDFTSILSSSGFDALIEKLNSKTKESEG